MCFVCLFPVEVEENIIKDRLSLYLYENIRSPLDEKDPIDHEIIFSLQYNDNVDYYYYQERDNGIFSREYSLLLQQEIYRNFYLAGFRNDTIYDDIWSIDAKYLIESNWKYDKKSWKTFIGISNCWDLKHSIKVLLEERKSFNIDIFLIPSEISFGIKTMSDFKRFYHEETIRAKFYVSLPLSWTLSKYIRTNLSLVIKSVDYGHYRWQQKLMLGIDIVK